MKKIALIGSAPASVQLAPYDDPSWTIWSCSPGARPYLRRVNAHFEIHLYEPHEPWFSKDYVDWMAALPCQLFMLEPLPQFPTSVAYPKAQVLDYTYGYMLDHEGISRPAKFNPNDFGSTLSWMLALAIMQRPDEIGLWGVDMAAGEEYGPQKDGCLALIHVARSVGIKVTIPPESDLLRPVPLYGFREQDPMFIKLSRRKTELTNQLNHWEQTYQNADRQRWFFQGAVADINYMMQTWVSDPQAIERMYANPEPRPIPVEEPPLPEMAPFAGQLTITEPMSATVPEIHIKPKRRKTNGSHPNPSV